MRDISPKTRAEEEVSLPIRSAVIPKLVDRGCVQVYCTVYRCTVLYTCTGVLYRCTVQVTALLYSVQVYCTGVLYR